MRLVAHTGSEAAEGSPRANDPLLPLARSAGQGDRNAMRELVKVVGPAMLRAVRKVMGPRTADVEDVLQDAVEGCLQALTSFKGQCTVLHFACRVAVLFSQANSVRRRGDVRGSIALYQALRQRFPASSQAMLSASRSSSDPFSVGETQGGHDEHYSSPLLSFGCVCADGHLRLQGFGPCLGRFAGSRRRER